MICRYSHRHNRDGSIVCTGPRCDTPEKLRRPR